MTMSSNVCNPSIILTKASSSNFTQEEEDVLTQEDLDRPYTMEDIRRLQQQTTANYVNYGNYYTTYTTH